MHQFPDRERASTPSDNALAERVEALAAWIADLEVQQRATATAADEKALKELRRTIEALSKRDPKFEERLTNKVDVVADRLQTLATTVSTTAAALAAKDGEIAALRRELDGGSARVDSVVSELRRSVDPTGLDELRRTVAALSEQKLPRKLDERFERLGSAVEVLGQRLDTLSSAVSTTAAGLAGREGELVALHRRLDEDSAHLRAAIAELRQAVDPAPVAELRAEVAAVANLTSAGERDTKRALIGLSVDLDTVTQRLDALTATVETATAGLVGNQREIAALRAHVEDGSERVGSLESGMEAMTARLADLPHRLDSLGAAVEATAAGHAAKEVELDALSERFDAARGQVESLVGDLREALDTMPRPGPDPASLERLETLERQVDALTAEIGRGRSGAGSDVEVATASLVDEETRRFLSELAGRLDAIERGRGSAEEEIARASEALAAERTLLESRLSGIAARVGNVESGIAEVLAESPGSELAQLRVLVDGLRMRLASSERELAALAGSRDTVARLDDLTRRLDALESTGDVLVPHPAPEPGDGRFRLELRSLELRMEHAEAAGRENREAVLVQLERLASRIEWRLQRLETEQAPEPSSSSYSQAASGGAQVVPIRSTEA